MAWTTPKTDWATGELVTAEDMNAVGENLAALKNLSTAVYTTTENIQLTSRDFADVDSDNLNLTITTGGGDVLVHFHGPVYVPRISAYFDVEVDGTRQGGDAGLGRVYGRDSLRTIVNFTLSDSRPERRLSHLQAQMQNECDSRSRAQRAILGAGDLADAPRSQERKEERYAK